MLTCPYCNGPMVPPKDAANSAGSELLGTVRGGSCVNCGIVPLPDISNTTWQYLPEQSTAPRLRIAHFEKVRLLGTGSFGEVWLAEDVDLGREVALKIPRPDTVGIDMLLHEARMAAKLRHPNIVTVHEVGHDDYVHFIAVEYIEGLSLADYLTIGRPSLQRVIDLVTTIGRSLHYAHEMGIVHRDVKPANILLDKRGVPFVTDFGIAMQVRSSEGRAGEGMIVGTIKYMSPEQAAGDTAATDHRADVYALGVILFEMLTGELPFRGSAQAILQQKQDDEAPTPRKFSPTLPKDLETVCRKSLERNAANRYASALEVVEELERVRQGVPIQARPISSVERGWRWCRRHPAVSGLLCSLFVSLTIGLTGVSYFWRQAVISHAAERSSLERAKLNLAANHLSTGDLAGVATLLAELDGPRPASRHCEFEKAYLQGTLKPLRQLSFHGDVVTDVAASWNGQLYASAGRDGKVEVRSADDGELVRSIPLGATICNALEFAANGTLIGGGSDGFVHVWEPAVDGRERMAFEHGPPVRFVRISHDGTTVVSAGSKGAARVWDLKRRVLAAEFPTGQMSNTTDVHLSADGQHLLIAKDDGTIRSATITPGTDPATPGTDPVPATEPARAPVVLRASPRIEAMAVSENRELVAIGSYHGEISLWNLPEKRQLAAYQARWGRIDAVTFLRGTELIAVVSSDGQLHIFNTASQRAIYELSTHGLATASLSRSRDGTSLVVGSGDGAVSLLHVDELCRPTILWHDYPVHEVEFLADGRQFVAVDESGHLALWNTQSGRSKSLDDIGGHAVRRFSLDRSRNRIATAGTEPGLAIHHLDSRKLVCQLSTAAPVAATKFSDGGQFLAIVDQNGRSNVFKSDAWEQPLFTSSGNAGTVTAMQFSPDERFLALAWENDVVQILDLPSGSARAIITFDAATPRSLAFSRSADLLVIGTSRGGIQLHDTDDGRILRVIRGHTGRVNAVAAMPDGETLATAGQDRMLHLWNIAAGELTLPLAGHFRQVFAVAVSPDGHTIVSSGLEGDIRVWKGDR